MSQANSTLTEPPPAAPAPNYEVRPKPGDRDGELLEVAMGPHHPSTHGVFRMDVVLDGERVVKLKPVFGYLHRNHEKIAEGTTYLGSMPYTDRLDYLAPLANNVAMISSFPRYAAKAKIGVVSAIRALGSAPCFNSDSTFF